MNVMDRLNNAKEIYEGKLHFNNWDESYFDYNEEFINKCKEFIINNNLQDNKFLDFNIAGDGEYNFCYNRNGSFLDFGFYRDEEYYSFYYINENKFEEYGNDIPIFTPLPIHIIKEIIDEATI